MKNRIIKVWSVLAVFAILSSMLITATPAQAAYGAQQWQAQSLPGVTGNTLLNGSDVGDIAVGSGVIYAVDSASAAGAVYKSTDGGASFLKLVAPAAVTLTMVSTPSDNANVVAVTNGLLVWISSDGGSTWSVLPALPTAGTSIRGLAVAPARTGTLLGREYFIAVANDTAATLTGGDVLAIGATAAWATAGGAAVTGIRDYMAVAVTPNFVGDRAVVAVGVAAAGTAAVQVINTATISVVSTAPLNAAGTTTDAGAAATSAVRASISLPKDFDATTTSGRRGYIGIAASTAQADNDVYRFDDTATRALGAVTTQGIYSVAFSGTVSAGTLVMGRRNAAEIKWTTDPTVASPTWTASTKYDQPGAVTPNLVLAMAPDFSTSKKVYAASSGAESALSVSSNGGITFSQVALIDTGDANNNVKRITDLDFSKDAKTAYLTTLSAAGNISIWKTSVPMTNSSWTRIFCRAGAGAKGSADLPGDNPTTGVMYLKTDVSPRTIYRSADNGETWNTRLPPVDAASDTDSLQDSNIWYWADNLGNIYKSTNGGFTWSGAVATGLTVKIKSIQIPKPDNLIIGANGMLGTSSDGGATFTKIDLQMPGEVLGIARDPGFATNNILYLADTANLTNKVYKLKLGTDTRPTDLLNPSSGAAGTLSSVGITGGVMYVNYKGEAGAGPVIDRVINFGDTPGTLTWTTVSAGTPAAEAAGYVIGRTTDKNTIIWLRHGITTIAAGANALWAYEDLAAKATVTVASPKDKASLSIDPITGRGERVTIALQPVGSGTGLVTTYMVQIAEKAAGFAAGTLVGPFIVTNAQSPQIIITDGPAATNFTFRANTVYVMRVRGVNQISGDIVDTPWSKEQEISVGSGGIVQQTQIGPVLTGPQGGATSVSTTPGFAWAAVAGATKYRFILATDAAMTKRVAGTPVTTTIAAFQATAALTANTTYFWSVQVIEPAEGPISVATFQTAAPPPAPAPVPKPAPAPIITITAPPVVIPPAPTPIITIPPQPAPVAPPTPGYIWAIIVIGAVLVIAVIVLILRTRKTV